MAASLTFGSVPSFYREVYKIVCPNEENRVERDVLIKVLMKSSLPKPTLTLIWESVDPKNDGYVTRDGLYKALALSALAQQGKPVSEKALESFIDAELPRPSLGDLSDLKKFSVQVQREQNPNILGYSYEELMALDNIEVELLAEKKGILLKHNEYHISSSRHNLTVSRRYNDFVAFHDLLISRFPYRMVPKLPPKKLMGANKEFIEARRRALKRFLTLVARHPILCNDKIVVLFFTIKGSDIGQKMKDQFKMYPDEFATSPLSPRIKELVPMDVQANFNASKKQINALHNSVEKMKDVADHLTARTLGFSSDMLYFAKELSALSNDSIPTTVWACGNNDSWGHLKHGFNGLTGHFSKLSDKASEWFRREDVGCGEVLALFLELTTSYKELCDRHEKGVLKDHQNSLHKMQQIKKRQISAQAKGQENMVDALESKIIEQEVDISNMENRNFFSLHCLQMETQLVHANLKMIAVALKKMVYSNALGNKEVAQVWAEIQPTMENLVPKDSGSSKHSPPGSPSLM
ncbi:sorting nexin-8 [Nematostella vectensis]|uniref:sorting nexin-8 n=1 Tax=Nematostella vectensis TaxID=45351 RepID=UPI0020771B7A|nr:sorting nexin-8 [Nematostella vectensis]